MNKLIRRLTAAAAAACITLTCAPLTRAAGDLRYSRTDDLGTGLSLTREMTKDSTGRGGRSYVFDYTPGGTVAPMIVYGDTLYGKSDVNALVSYCESQGQTVLAAVNADFFNITSGVPTGLVVREGRLISSDGAWNAVGIRRDGTMLVGAPKLDISFSVNGGQRFPVAGFNKVRDRSGVFLYSDDYDYNTRLSAEGPTVVLEKLNYGESLTIGGSVAFRVRSAGMESGAAMLDGYTMVLTAQKGVETGIDLTALQPGDLVTVYTGTRSTGWDDVWYACGAGDMMIDKSALTEKAMKSQTKSPRTMLGIRRDGSCVVLVCDGRDGGVADGMTLQEAAMKLYAMGCLNVVNLDGGGSSIASVRDPGLPQASVISDPSDGKPRECADYLVFTASGDASAKDRYVTVYPKDELVLAGGTIDLTAYSYNEDYFPGKEIITGFTVESGGGKLSGNTLTLPDKAGDVVVGVKAKGLTSVPATVTSVAEPAVMTVVKAGTARAVTSLALAGGDTVDLDVIVSDGLRPIRSSDEQFTFAVEGDIGEIDERGVFTAAELQGFSGAITVAFGSQTRRIDVTVGKAPEALSGFETTVGYGVNASDTTTASVKIDNTGDNARFGKGSLSMKYETGAEPDLVVFSADGALTIPSGMRELTLWARGTGDWQIMFSTNTGTAAQPLTMNEDEWTMNVVEVPYGARAVTGFCAYDEAEESGYAFIDQLIGHYGEAQTDDTAPVIANASYEEQLRATVLDDSVYPLEKNNISVTVDGVAIRDFTYDHSTGALTVNAAADGALHRATIVATDYFGNRSRLTLEAEGTAAGPYDDVAGHWAEKYINYLYNKGVTDAASEFGPRVGATNELVATMISRYMGVDVSKYESVELPYVDLDEASDWAIPHLKAMYALGIMVGGPDSEGNTWFYPAENTNRARVMTVLGRTIPRGYDYADAAYSDMADVPAWAFDHVSLLTHLGVVNGYGDGTNRIMPAAGITRSELAAILYRLY